ncbi:MAG: pilin [bacterium]|nr:pilin [bacterium]
MNMKFIKDNWQTTLVFTFGFILPITAFGQGTVPAPKCLPGQICNPLPKITSIPNLIQTILEGAIKIGLPIVALAIIYAGFLFVFARGNPEKLGTAKDTLLYTLIGAAILLGAWAIAKMIESTVLGITST